MLEQKPARAGRARLGATASACSRAIKAPKFPDARFSDHRFWREAGRPMPRAAIARGHRRLHAGGRRTRGRAGGRVAHRARSICKSNVNLHVSARRHAALQHRPGELPASCSRAGRAPSDELLAVHLRVRAGEHRDHRQGHARRPGADETLVALEATSSAGAATNQKAARDTLDRRWARTACRSRSACSATGTTCGRTSSSPTAATTS